MTVMICYATCWECKFDCHYDPPKAHSWMDSDDEEWTPDVNPMERLCACPCGREEVENGTETSATTTPL